MTIREKAGRCDIGACQGPEHTQADGIGYCERHWRLKERGALRIRTDHRRRIECTEETKRCRNGKLLSRYTPKCCRAHIRTLVFELDELFAEAGVRWWIDYGTLLGAVRGRGLIPHDKDADVGVIGEDFDAVLGLEERFVNLGRNFNYRQRGQGKFKSGHRVKVRLSDLNHINVDIFPWYRGEDGVWYRVNYAGVDKYKGREFPERRLLPLSEIEWEGRMLPAPADPEWFCEHRYGRKWRTPIGRNNDGMRR